MTRNRLLIGLDGKPIISEEIVRAWVRDEQRKIELEKQATCVHSKSGTIIDNGDVRCDDCLKILDIEEDGNMESVGGEFNAIGVVR